jgi:ribosomal protein S14
MIKEAKLDVGSACEKCGAAEHVAVVGGVCLCGECLRKLAKAERIGIEKARS